MKTANIFSMIPENIPEEKFETILSSSNITIERIISRGHSSPEGFWYDQEKNEWVMVVRGKAGILFENQEEPVVLKTGDHLLIPARCRHRVEWTDPEGITIWIAVHY